MSDIARLFDLGTDPAIDDNPLAWQEEALCAQTDPEAFFPEKGGSTREAKRICVSCTVKQDCLEYALVQDERFGIWGGLSERERRRIKRLPDRAAVVAAVTSAPVPLLVKPAEAPVPQRPTITEAVRSSAVVTQPRPKPLRGWRLALVDHIAANGGEITGKAKEIGEALGMPSPANMALIIRGLEEDGHLIWERAGIRSAGTIKLAGLVSNVA